MPIEWKDVADGVGLIITGVCGPLLVRSFLSISSTIGELKLLVARIETTMSGEIKQAIETHKDEIVTLHTRVNMCDSRINSQSDRHTRIEAGCDMKHTYKIEATK